MLEAYLKQQQEEREREQTTLVAAVITGILISVIFVPLAIVEAVVELAWKFCKAAVDAFLVVTR